MFKKKVAIYTGSRSDYEILKPLILKLQKNYSIKLFVGPHHFQNKFGKTYNLIKKDKIRSYYKCLTKLNYDKVDISKFICNSIFKYKSKLLKLNPDLVIILGDRYEVLSFVLASFFLNIKVCHLHGGEITNGSFDDTIRHMISKMSDYHFVTSDNYKKRLSKMGENPKNIFNFGSIGALNVKKTQTLPRSVIYKKLKIPAKSKIVTITFHPETNSKIKFKDQIRIFLNSLKNNKKFFFIFTGCNADPYGNYFNTEIKRFVSKNKNCLFFKNLGGVVYFSLINYSEFILGNSSSGIYEVPILRKITINVGSRQSGRMLPKSIINCELNSLKIKKLLKKFYTYKKNIKFNNLFYKRDVLSKMTKQINKIINVEKKIKVFYEKKK